MSRILDGFLARNPSWRTRKTRDLAEVRRAMVLHRRRHPRCEISGVRRRLEVHHIHPVSTHPHLAADPGNLMTLTRSVHRGLAHPGSTENYLANIRSIAALMLIQRTGPAPRESH